ncbi:hypothetical protein HW452_09890 [Halomonas aquamarina]|uniref:Uncharacterized protein n=1 Tax=Vreelandella aquamarina TaxID=77097 RepID=A0ACC5VVM2_9GAMM|nr:hypothetical protein [Halomonas aquamarina]MBZ5487836.1 hypothetical protein [Halomonas aquamarina]
MAILEKCTECGSEDLHIPEEGEKDQSIYCNACNAVLGNREKLIKKEKEDEGEGDHQVEKLLRGLSGKE